MDKKDENSKIEKSSNIKNQDNSKYKELLLKYRRTTFKNKITTLLLNKLLKK